MENVSNRQTFSSHKGPYCLQRWCFTAVIMGFSRLNIKEEIQSSKYDHRIFWLLTSGQQGGNKKRPQSYWLRQHCLVCLCWTHSLQCSWWHTGQKSFLTYMEGHTSAACCTSNRQSAPYFFFSFLLKRNFFKFNSFCPFTLTFFLFLFFTLIR